MHDELTDKERADCTAHELELLTMLSSAPHTWKLSLAARRLVAGAITEWRRGFYALGSLLEDDTDADGRLAAIRAGLLGGLAELAPEGLPLPALLGLGDATPKGWTVAVRIALLQAGAGGSQPRRREHLRARTRVDSLAAAGRMLGSDELAVAHTFDAVTLGDRDGAVLVSLPSYPHDGDEWRRSAPQLGLRRLILETPRVVWTLVDDDVWCAASALVAALRATPLMGLPSARQELVELELRSALGDLITGIATGEEAIDDLLDELDRFSVLLGDVPRPEGEKLLRWPSAHAALMRTIDRYAGAGGERVELPIAPGTWVEVVDRADDGSSRLAGWVVDPPVTERSRTWSVQLGKAARRDESELFAYVRTAAADVRVPFAHLRRPRRISLFG